MPAGFQMLDQAVSGLRGFDMSALKVKRDYMSKEFLLSVAEGGMPSKSMVLHN